MTNQRSEGYFRTMGILLFAGMVSLFSPYFVLVWAGIVISSVLVSRRSG